jgi:hypothetical protein
MPLTQVSPGLLDSNAQYYGMKNRIINGAMVIDQRNNGASVTPASGQYTLDRWQAQLSSASKFSIQRSAIAPAGFSNSLLVTSLGAYSVTSGDFFVIQHNIEGFNFADFGWGSANAQPATLSFWVRSSLTGTFTGSFRNSAGNRAYPYSYTIISANTWQFVSITVTGDTTGTWVGATNGTGVQIFFDFGSGSANQGTPGAWVNGSFNAATGQTNLLGTNGATFYITGVQLEKGSTATSFDYRPYGTELQLAQRYFLQYGKIGDTFAPVSPIGTASSTTDVKAIYLFPTIMRATPTATQGSLQLADSVSSFAVTAISQGANEQSPIACNVNFSVASGLTQFRPYWARCVSNANGFVAFSAEL